MVALPRQRQEQEHDEQEQHRERRRQQRQRTPPQPHTIAAARAAAPTRSGLATAARALAFAAVCVAGARDWGVGRYADHMAVAAVARGNRLLSGDDDEEEVLEVCDPGADGTLVIPPLGVSFETSDSVPCRSLYVPPACLSCFVTE